MIRVIRNPRIVYMIQTVLPQEQLAERPRNHPKLTVGVPQLPQVRDIADLVLQVFHFRHVLFEGEMGVELEESLQG